MAFLKNDNNKITIQAVLTEDGKQKMSAGTLHIDSFKCFDDGVDYELYNTLHPQGSDYYDSAITNLPIIEPMVQSPVPLKYPKYWLNPNDPPITNGWSFTINGWNTDIIEDADNKMTLTYSYSTAVSNLEYDLTKMFVRASIIPVSGYHTTGMAVSLIPTLAPGFVLPSVIKMMPPKTGQVATEFGHSFEFSILRPATALTKIILVSELYILGVDNTWSVSNVNEQFVTVMSGWGSLGPNYAGRTALGVGTI